VSVSASVSLSLSVSVSGSVSVSAKQVTVYYTVKAPNNAEALLWKKRLLNSLALHPQPQTPNPTT